METKVKALIEAENLLSGGDAVLVALSGGCDSVGLLLCLSALKDPLKLKLFAAHVNHGIRGTEADRDETFVRALCARRGVPLAVYRENVPAEAALSGESEEEAGRRLRYRDLCEAAKAVGAKCIATAHHRDDQAETLLLNLIRGSGISGLAGMRLKRPVGDPSEGLTLIRPFLAVSRAEIEEYVRGKNESWCEDSTNGDEEYSRNRIRNSLIPEAEKLRPGAAKHIAAAAEKLRAAEDYLEEETERQYEACRQKDGSLRLSGLSELRPFLRQRVLARWLTDKGGTKDVGEVHYAALENLLPGDSGKSLDLPGGRRVLREQKTLRILEGKTLPKPEGPKAADFTLRLLERENAGEIPQKQYTKWLDHDIINNTLVFRTRREGDYFTLPDGGRKSVKQYFIDEKIPLSERDSVPLVADGSHVLWIVGHRISAAARIGEDTKTILEITYGGSYGKASCECNDQ